MRRSRKEEWNMHLRQVDSAHCRDKSTEKRFDLASARHGAFMEVRKPFSETVMSITQTLDVQIMDTHHRPRGATMREMATSDDVRLWITLDGAAVGEDS